MVSIYSLSTNITCKTLTMILEQFQEWSRTVPHLESHNMSMTHQKSNPLEILAKIKSGSMISHQNWATQTNTKKVIDWSLFSVR